MSTHDQIIQRALAALRSTPVPAATPYVVAAPRVTAAARPVQRDVRPQPASRSGWPFGCREVWI